MRCLLAHQIDDLRSAFDHGKCGASFAGFDKRTTGIPGKRVRDFCQGQDEINGAGRNRAERHAVIFGLLRLLDDDQATGRLDRSCSLAAVGGCSREDDADCALPDSLGQGAQQKIERHPHDCGASKMKRAVAYGDEMARWNDTHRIGLESHAFARFKHRHRGGGRQQLNHLALVAGIKMLDQDECHPALGGKGRQDCPKGLKPAGRGAYRDDRKIGFAVHEHRRLARAPIRDALGPPLVDCCTLRGHKAASIPPLYTKSLRKLCVLPPKRSPCQHYACRRSVP